MKRKLEYYVRVETEGNHIQVNGFTNVNGGENIPLVAEDYKELALLLLELIRLWNAGTEEVETVK